jgi:long-chain acyl-CoA synthetase
VSEKVRTELAAAVPSSFTTNHADALADIASLISKDVPGKLIPSAKLGPDLKLDSLGRVELLSAIEDRYQVEIDEAAFTDATTLGEVERIVREGKHEEAAPYPYPRWQQRWPISWLRILLVYLIVLPATRIMGLPRIRGKEHLRNLRGPLVFVCNHVTMTDHALVLLALPARFKTKMAIAQDGELLREWRRPSSGTGLFTRSLYLLQYFSVVFFFNVFSMPQKSGFRRSFAFAGENIDRGYNLLIFPEGERTKHGGLNSFMPGTGLLISQLEAPVVPIRIDGLWELKQAHRHFAWPGEVSVTIGAPVRYSNQQQPGEIAADLAQRVKAL